MSLLLDICPSFVEIEGLKVPIKSDFRTSVLFETAMQDKEISEEEKLKIALTLYFPNTYLPDVEKAVERFIWFYSCGKELKNGAGEGGRTKEIYSFEHDDEYIYAAFLEQYGIDLNTDDLHWWKFRALFRSLKEDCLMSKIMMYRAIDITSDMSKAEQKFYRSMKALYSLPDLRTQEEKEEEFAEVLFNSF